MDEKDLPSSSDESDADFVPKDEDYNSGSGSEVSDCVSSGEEDDEGKSGKRKKSNKKGKKSIKKCKVEDNGKYEEKEETEEKSNIYVDALWADFKKDVNNKVPNETAEPIQECKTVNKNKEASELDLEAGKPIVCSKLPPKSNTNFASKGRSGGLSNVLSQIGKKGKMSTLEKSQLDWNNFKKSEGIEEEIKMHNRGKDGYLEKQDFLQRTDLRQFEIEKDLRSARRKF